MRPIVLSFRKIAQVLNDVFRISFFVLAQIRVEDRPTNLNSLCIFTEANCL